MKKVTGWKITYQNNIDPLLVFNTLDEVKAWVEANPEDDRTGSWCQIINSIIEEVE